MTIWYLCSKTKNKEFLCMKKKRSQFLRSQMKARNGFRMLIWKEIEFFWRNSNIWAKLLGSKILWSKNLKISTNEVRELLKALDKSTHRWSSKSQTRLQIWQENSQKQWTQRKEANLIKKVSQKKLQSSKNNGAHSNKTLLSSTKLSTSNWISRKLWVMRNREDYRKKMKGLKKN